MFTYLISYRDPTLARRSKILAVVDGMHCWPFEHHEERQNGRSQARLLSCDSSIEDDRSQTEWYNPRCLIRVDLISYHRIVMSVCQICSRKWVLFILPSDHEASHLTPMKNNTDSWAKKPITLKKTPRNPGLLFRVFLLFFPGSLLCWTWHSISINT